MIVFGIDPGVSGAISVFENKKIINFFDMPIMIDGKKNKRQVNAAQLAHEIKSRVVEKDRELQRINVQIAEEKKNILILKTELAYLGSPERISKLQAKHLQLKPVSKEQFEKFEEK